MSDLAHAAAPVVSKPAKQAKGNIIKSKYRDIYKKNGTYSCGDDMADELRAYLEVKKDGKTQIDLVLLRKVADDNGIWKERYANLNPGMRRMTIGKSCSNAMHVAIGKAV